MKRGYSTEIKVGLFVLIALLIGGTIAFTLGKQRAIFASKAEYYAVFRDVGGLRGGSPVHIGGVNVGSVSEVSFRDDGKVRVEIHVAETSKGLVRQGSVASLSNKGMLGDKLVNITVGDGRPLPEGSSIPSDETASLSYYLDRAGHLLSDAEGTAENLRKATEGFADPELAEDIKQTADNAAKVSEMAAEGGGPLEAILTDEELTRSLRSATGNLETASAELAHTTRSVRSIADEVRRGDGSAHELIYGQEGTRMVRSFADAAGETAAILREVRQGDGTLHRLVYGEEGSDLIASLTAVSRDLEAITSDVRDGKGTIGGLLRDPSIYEDIKRLVGDLQRNEILRALVRYSIRRDESVEPVEVQQE